MRLDIPTKNSRFHSAQTTLGGRGRGVDLNPNPSAIMATVKRIVKLCASSMMRGAARNAPQRNVSILMSILQTGLILMIKLERFIHAVSLLVGWRENDSHFLSQSDHPRYFPMKKFA